MAINANCKVTGNFCAISVSDRFFQPHRLTEIAGEHAADPMHILHIERLIEPVLPADLFQDRRVALLTGHGKGRIAGEQLLQARR